MNRKLIYVCSLLVFFVMWGVFGFAAGSPRREVAAPIAKTPVLAQPTVVAAAIPITGDPQPKTSTFVAYGIAGLAVLTMILMLLNAANKPTRTPVPHKDPSEESKKKP